MNKVPRKSRQANYKRFSAEAHAPLSHSTRAAQRRSPTASFSTNQLAGAANPAGKGTAAPNGHSSAATIKRACFPQVNERLDCAPSKLARQQRHKRENETAAASDPCRSKRTNTLGRRIRKFAQTRTVHFVPRRPK